MECTRSLETTISRLIHPISHRITPTIPIINLLPKSPYMSLRVLGKGCMGNLKPSLGRGTGLSRNTEPETLTWVLGFGQLPYLADIRTLTFLGFPFLGLYNTVYTFLGLGYWGRELLMTCRDGMMLTRLSELLVKP